MAKKKIGLKTAKKPKKTGEKRDKRGHFLQGTAPGPGRPEGSISILTVIKQDLEKGKMKKVTDIIWELVEKKKWDTIKTIWEYVDGRPKEKGELDIRMPELKEIADAIKKLAQKK